MPKKSTPPFQPILYFSGQGAQTQSSSENKQQIVYEGGHTLFGLTGTEIKGGVLQWMDEHLGPVN